MFWLFLWKKFRTYAECARYKWKKVSNIINIFTSQEKSLSVHHPIISLYRLLEQHQSTKVRLHILSLQNFEQKTRTPPRKVYLKNTFIHNSVLSWRLHERRLKVLCDQQQIMTCINFRFSKWIFEQSWFLVLPYDGSSSTKITFRKNVGTGNSFFSKN